MTFIDLLKKYGLLAAVILASDVHTQETPRGLIGGTSNGNAYASTVLGSSVDSQILNLPSGNIQSVAINNLGYGLIGGFATGFEAYAASISPSSNVPTKIFKLPATPGFITAVAINSSGQGLIGGLGNGLGYAAFVSPFSNVAQQVLSESGIGINAVAINNSGQGVVGGESVTPTAFASLVSPSGAIPILNLPTSMDSLISSVAINDAGQVLLGGASAANTPYVATVSGNVATALFTGITAVGSTINSVAINRSGQGLIGGIGGSTGAYAAVIAPSSNIVTPILDQATGSILSVAINDFGQGLIGGVSTTNGVYAAILTSPNGTLIPILSLPSSGQISSVAINNFGQGYVAGYENGAAYAALVSSNMATAIPLSLPVTSEINSVSIMNLFTSIPTDGIRGNSLAFADYINSYVPQNAFYFIPALFDGTLAGALESAAPTRNAISFNTVMQNTFYLTTAISTHLRAQPFVRKRGLPPKPDGKVALSNDELLAALTPQEKKPFLEEATDSCSVWVEAMGAFAKQAEQHQTPEFHPATGGMVVAFDAVVRPYTKVGCGMSYLFTHINEKEHAGYSNINQETLFAYASWEAKNYYIDAALSGGLFQTKQTRKIHMSGFDFRASSDPDGGLLTPHLEFGYNYQMTYSQNLECDVTPLIMLDWANAWQSSYKEKGSSPFNAGEKSHHASLLRTEAGFRFSEILYYRPWNLIFQEKISYVNTHSFGAGRMNAFLVGSPNTFTVETLTTAQNLGLVQFLITFAPRKAYYPISTFFYQGEFGGSYQSHQINLELGWNF